MMKNFSRIDQEGDSMKKERLIKYFLILLCTCAVLVYTVLIQPVLHERACRTRVFTDMQERLDEVALSVIGILPRTEKEDGSVSYGGGGTGVIYASNSNTYYAVTAAHVVNNPAAENKVYTLKTEYTVDPVMEELGIEAAAETFYESLADAKIEYISPDSDIAVISFESEDELSCAEFEEKMPAKGDRIVCLGHPDSRKLTVTYGTIKTGLKKVEMKDRGNGTKASDLVMEHDAWLNSGSSGGPAFSENMKLYGINTGGSFTLTGNFRKGFMIPYDQLEECISHVISD